MLSGYSWKPDSHAISYSLMVEPGYFTDRVNVDAALAHGIMQVDVKSGEVSEIFALQDFSLVPPKYSSNGAQLAYLVGFGSIDQVDGYQLMVQAVDSSEETMLLEGDQIETYTWSDDGGFLAASLGFYGSADIVVIDVVNETVTVVAQGWDPDWQK